MSIPAPTDNMKLEPIYEELTPWLENHGFVLEEYTESLPEGMGCGILKFSGKFFNLLFIKERNQVYLYFIVPNFKEAYSFTQVKCFILKDCDWYGLMYKDNIEKLKVNFLIILYYFQPSEVENTIKGMELVLKDRADEYE